MCDKLVDELARELDAANKDFALYYLQSREHESAPGKFLSVDDAKANAVDAFRRAGRPLPETLRFRLHALLAIERAVDPS